METLKRRIGCIAFALAFICLIGDGIRFIKKCISPDEKGCHRKVSIRICPLCGKSLQHDACFCSGCGGELIQKP